MSNEDLIDYIRREACPTVVETVTKECGCVYKKLDTGGQYWSPCKQHDHTAYTPTTQSPE